MSLVARGGEVVAMTGETPKEYAWATNALCTFRLDGEVRRGKIVRFDGQTVAVQDLDTGIVHDPVEIVAGPRGPIRVKGK